MQAFKVTQYPTHTSITIKEEEAWISLPIDMHSFSKPLRARLVILSVNEAYWTTRTLSLRDGAGGGLNESV